MNIRQQYKKNYFIGWVRVVCTGIFLLSTGFLQSACSQGENQKIHDLGNGFLDHGVAVPIASSRGTVTTIDSAGHNVILTWLSDHRGTYSLLMIDTDQETSKQFSLPFTAYSYTSLLSKNNRYYTHFKSRFVEFDPAKPGFTFIGKTSPGEARSMTEDEDGIIWAALSPDCSLVSYNPKTGELTDYGSMYSHKARQKPRSIATDDSGWVYVIAGPPGNKEIVAFNPETKNKKSVEKETNIDLKRVSSLFEGQNGKVYGRFKGEEKLVELSNGQLLRGATGIKKRKDRKYHITGNQALFNRNFPDNKRISGWISAVNPGFLRSRKVTIDDPKTGQSREIIFDYETEGANIMGIANTIDGKIIGGSHFPMNFFQYDPHNGEWNRYRAYGQFNTIAIQGNRVFIGGYPRGFLLEWNPEDEWVPTQKEREGTNPQFLARARPEIIRPHDLLVYPDGRTIIMAGRPPGGQTGSGLFFWDRKNHTTDILRHAEILHNQSTQSLVPLPNNKILGGTTIQPGDAGGTPVAEEAELYIMDIKSKKVEWSKAVISGVKNYQDLYIASNGLVMGVAERHLFFVFDPQKRELLQQVNLKETFGSEIPYTQGQRSFIKGANDEIYLLLQTGILQVNPDNFKITLLAESPEIITGGGAYFNGYLYFISGRGSHIYSYDLSAKEGS